MKTHQIIILDRSGIGAREGEIESLAAAVLSARAAGLHPLVRTHEPLLRAVHQPLKDAFFYVGANQDLSEVGRRMHIPASNMVSYAPSREETQEAFDVVSKAICSLIGVESMSSAEFFGGGKAGSKGKGTKRTKR